MTAIAKLAYKRGDLFLDFDMVHAIVPNTGFIPGAIGTKGKKWLSLWWETSRRVDEDFLHEGGYDYFPVMVPRWQVTGVDCYGSSPGMKALADVRALQHLEEQAIDAAAVLGGVEGQVGLAEHVG